MLRDQDHVGAAGRTEQPTWYVPAWSWQAGPPSSNVMQARQAESASDTVYSRSSSRARGLLARVEPPHAAVLVVRHDVHVDVDCDRLPYHPNAAHRPHLPSFYFYRLGWTFPALRMEVEC